MHGHKVNPQVITDRFRVPGCIQHHCVVSQIPVLGTFLQVAHGKQNEGLVGPVWVWVWVWVWVVVGAAL